MLTQKEYFCKEDLILKLNSRAKHGFFIEEFWNDGFRYSQKDNELLCNWDETLFQLMKNHVSLPNRFYTYFVKGYNGTFENFCVHFFHNNKQYVLENFINISANYFEIRLSEYCLSKENLDAYYLNISSTFNELNFDKVWLGKVITLLYNYSMKHSSNRLRMITHPLNIQFEPFLKPFYQQIKKPSQT